MILYIPFIVLGVLGIASVIGLILTIKEWVLDILEKEKRKVRKR